MKLFNALCLAIPPIQNVFTFASEPKLYASKVSYPIVLFACELYDITYNISLISHDVRYIMYLWYNVGIEIILLLRIHVEL